MFFKSFERTLNTGFIKLLYSIYIELRITIFNDSKYNKERPISWILTRVNINILEMDAEIDFTNGYKYIHLYFFEQDAQQVSNPYYWLDFNNFCFKLAQ